MQSYAAFISYSHKADANTAKALRHDLERFGAGLFQSRRFRIWQDEASMAMSPDLWNEIARALDYSQCLLVLLSPESVRSIWVKREIAYFVEKHSRDKVGLILTSGRTPWTDAGTAPADAELLELLQPLLTDEAARQPLVIDLRPFRRSDGRLKRSGGALRNQIATIAARLDGKSKDEIYGEHIQALRRRVTLYASLAFALVGAMGIALVEYHEAEVARERAEVAREQERARNAALLATQPGRELEALPPAILAADWGFKHLKRLPVVMVQGLVAANTAATRSRILARHQGDVMSARYSRDGTLAVTASSDGRVKVWRVADGTPVSTVSELRFVSHAIFAGKAKVVTVAPGNLMAWDLAGNERWRRPAPDDPATTVQASGDGTRILVTGKGHAQIWNPDTPELLLDIPANRAALSRDARWIAAMTADVIRLIHLAANRADIIEEIPLVNPDAGGYSLALSPDGSSLAVGSDDGSVAIWDVAAARIVNRLGGHSAAVEYLHFSSTGRQLVSASSDRSARVWDLGSRQLLATCLGHKRRLYTATFASDDRHILTSSGDGTARVFSLADTERVFDVQSGAPGRFPMGATSESPPRAIRFFPKDGGRFVVLEGTDRLVGWDLGTGASIGGIETLGVCGFRFSGEALLTLTTRACLIRRNDNAATRDNLPIGEPERCWFSPSGEYGLAVSKLGQTQLFETRAAKLVGALGCPSKLVVTAAFAAQAERIVVAGGDAVARVFRIPSGHLVSESSRHNAPLTSVAISPDGQLMVTGTRDGVATAWRIDRKTASAVHTIRHQGRVNATAWSPDSRHAASGDLLGNLSLFQRESSSDLRLAGHLGSVTQVAFSPDGSSLASASLDGTVALWDVAHGELLASLHIRTEALDVAFSPDGSQLAAIGFDGRAYVFPAAAREFFHAACTKLPDRAEFANARASCAERDLRHPNFLR